MAALAAVSLPNTAGVSRIPFPARARQTLPSSLSSLSSLSPLPSRGPAHGAPAPRAPARRLTPAPRASVLQSLPREYGAVVLTAVASVVLTQWQMFQVAKARKEAGVPYPKMYEDKEDSVFNCSQRAHQNTLESLPSLLALLLVAGLAYPKASSICGMVWVVGRVFYSLGYYTGEPKNRMRGMWGTFGFWGLIITAAVAGVRQLM